MSEAAKKLKLSGAAGKKKRADLEERKRKFAAYFVTPTPVTPSAGGRPEPVSQYNSDEENSGEENLDEVVNKHLNEFDTKCDNLTEVENESRIATQTEYSAEILPIVGIMHDATNEDEFLNSQVEPNFHLDPALWPGSLHGNKRDYLILHGSKKQPLGHQFPISEGRRFSHNHFTKRMANGEDVKRSWLVYSESTDTVFCVACKLFDRSGKVGKLKDDELKDWKHISELLLKHDYSKCHKQSCISWIQAQTSLNKCKGIDSLLQRQILDEKQRWRNVMERIIEVIKFLASHNLAFQGSSEKLYTKNNGTFLGLIELLAKFDPVLESHLQNASSGARSTHYLSHSIQNEIIQVIASQVKDSILTKIKESKYFSVMLDCTPDISHIEQMSAVFRYVSIDDVTVEIRESFLGFLPIKDKTGAGLTDIFLNWLEIWGLPLADMRGQCYDNGSNMKGRISGVQKRIQDRNNLAFFLPCVNHTSNLMIGDSAKSSTIAITFFGTVQKLYTFASGSTNRWDIFRKHLNRTSLKSHSATRWESRMDCLKPLRYQIANVQAALLEIADSTKFDNDTRFEANNLLSQIEKFEFLILLAAWYDILHRINIARKLTQGESMDVSEASRAFDETERFLEKYKETGFSDAQITARALANELGLAEEDIKFQETRRRTRKRHFDDELPSTAATSTSAKTLFRENCFDVLVDTAVESSRERFEQMRGVMSNFQILYDTKFRCKASKEEIKKHCMDLQNLLTSDTTSDVDENQLYEEFILVKDTFPDAFKLGPLKLLEFVVQHKLAEVCPNIFIVLRIVLTMPFSVAACERSFSKLKLIKTYLRSTMSQERLDGLAMLSIEAELVEKLNFAGLLEDFASRKARKIDFGRPTLPNNTTVN